MRASFLRATVALSAVGLLVTGAVALSGNVGDPACQGDACASPTVEASPDAKTPAERPAARSIPRTPLSGSSDTGEDAEGSAVAAGPGVDQAPTDEGSGGNETSASPSPGGAEPGSPSVPSPSRSASPAAPSAPSPSAKPASSPRQTAPPAPPATTPSSFPSTATTGHRTPLAQLTPSGSITVTQDGAVLQGLHVRGSVTVEAHNVTIRDSFIEYDGSMYPIRRGSGVENLVVEDTTIDGGGKAAAAIYNKAYTLTRVEIRNVIDGPRIEGDDVVIQHSLIHQLVSDGGTHNDAIQIRNGENIRIIGNSLLAYNTATGQYMNAAIQIDVNSTGPISNVLIEGNYLTGGNVTINAGRESVSSGVARNNVFEKNARYDAVGNLGSGWVWENNRYVDGSKAG